MSDPSSGSTSASGEAGMFGTALGGIGKAIGDISGGESTKAMYDYQAGVANLNAQIARQNEEYAIQTGEHQAVQAGLQGAATSGQIKAAQGASGLDVNSGSAKDVQASQTLINRTNMANIRSNAAKTAYNYENEAVGFNAQAGLDTLAGQSAQTASYISAASSIIGGASSVASQWQKGSQVGLFPSGGSSGSVQLFGS